MHLVDTVIDKGGAVTSWLVRLSPVERSEFEAWPETLCCVFERQNLPSLHVPLWMRGQDKVRSASGKWPKSPEPESRCRYH